MEFAINPGRVFATQVTDYSSAIAICQMIRDYYCPSWMIEFRNIDVQNEVIISAVLLDPSITMADIEMAVKGMNPLRHLLGKLKKTSGEDVEVFVEKDSEEVGELLQSIIDSNDSDAANQKIYDFVKTPCDSNNPMCAEKIVKIPKFFGLNLNLTKGQWVVINTNHSLPSVFPDRVGMSFIDNDDFRRMFRPLNESEISTPKPGRTQ